MYMYVCTYMCTYIYKCISVFVYIYIHTVADKSLWYKHFIQTQTERNCDDPATKGGALLSDHTICHTWLLMRMSSVGSDNFLHHGGNMVDEVTDGDLG